MTVKTISVIRVDYELQSKPDYKWVANIAAYSDDEALNFLRKKLGNIKVIAIERKTRLDAITDEVEETIIRPYKEMMENEAKEAKKEVKPKKPLIKKDKK
jgi:hypothetical protein